jgi:DNA-binding NtrC family response regulator
MISDDARTGGKMLMKTVLVVDDEQEVLDSLGECLTRSGFRVITMTDGNSALSVARKGVRVDLVIADYRMRRMDGLELLARLKEILPSVPVIILSGQVSVECYLKSLSLGAFEYVTKPFEPKDLERVVKAAFGEGEAGSGRISKQTIQA